MLAARHDFPVHFHGDATLAVSGRGKQVRDRGLGLTLMRLAVEENLHARSVTPAMLDRGATWAVDSADRVIAAFGWMFPRRRLAALRSGPFAGLRCTLHFALLHLLLALHLHFALLLLHLHGASLLGLLLLHLHLALLLHLLLASTLLRLHLRITLLLRLLVSHPLLRLGLCLPLLVRTLVVDLLGCPFDRPHDRQAPRSPCVLLWFGRGADHGCAWQRCGLVGVRETRGWQLVGA